jgi:bifunctional non-homologous end joining protein LigD
MSLREYKRKRHFKRTLEPAGKLAHNKGTAFVIQKHDARNLHYDFRLELGGVLKSWAVPKGPSLDPDVKRLAMQVEDHPVEYGSFEGIIPAGEYGGGTVMLWDKGTWEPIGNSRESYAKGRLKFILHGQKLHGGWVLVRTHGGAPLNGQKQRWLLFKERDEEAKPTDKGDVLDNLPASAATGRSLEEIAADSDRVWASNEESKAMPSKRAVKPKKCLQKKRLSKAKQGSQSAIEYDTRKQQLDGVRLTNPDKVLYPDQGITKLELANYYATVADWILPHITNRPLVLVRCPEGQAKECFFQKHPRAGTPEQLRQIEVQEKNKTEPYVLADDTAGLISLAQIGVLEIHAWGSRADKLEQPDRLIFDLDPDPLVSWGAVVQAAHAMRKFLQELGLESFVKTTGGKGLNLVVPIRRHYEWPEAKAFCKRIAELIVLADPAHFTANMSKAARPRKIFVDYLRNDRGATAIVPYSTGAKLGAPVSVPLTWGELTDRVHSNQYTIRNLPRRLASLKRDPWEGIATVKQDLAGPIEKDRALTRSAKSKA